MRVFLCPWIGGIRKELWMAVRICVGYSELKVLIPESGVLQAGIAMYGMKPVHVIC